MGVVLGKYPVQGRPDGVSRFRRNTPIFDEEADRMASNQDTLVTVFGGSGFLGRNVVRALCKRDYRIRVAVRRPELAGHLQPLGRVGQIHAVQANVRYPASVEAAMRDSYVAINLVGILAPSGAQTFDAVQARGAETIAEAAAAVGASMVHVSAIGADENSPSHYARAKAAGEKAVLAALPSTTIMRPSIVFGPEDEFTNRFAALARLAPALPLIGGGNTRMQPVYVGDVATAIADAVDGKARAGATYELGGPEVLSFREIIELILEITDRKRMLMSLPFGLARLQAIFLQFAPGALKLTPDQVELLRSDNVVSEAAKAAGLTLEGLGVTPDSLEAIAPQYLWRFRPAGQFQRKDA
jgi:NADH dehydrogenase